MSNIFNYYFVQVSLLMALFYLLYWSLLRRETFFKWNRAYLLATPLLALIIPILPIPAGFTEAVQQTPVYETYVENFAPTKVALTNPEIVTRTTSFSWVNLLWTIYFIGMSYFTFRFLSSLFFIMGLVRKFEVKKQQGYKIVEVNLPDLPIFSFGPLIFWNAHTSITPEKQAQVMQHEITHVRQRHTWDILYLELLGIVFWFNPICIFYKRSIQNIHEYLADYSLIDKGVDKKEYCDLLVSQLLDSN